MSHKPRADAPEKISHLFQKSRQLDSSDARPMSGPMSVQSTPDAGATFSIHLPTGGVTD